MDMETDKELLWIARTGLKVPLPAPWKPCTTGEDRASVKMGCKWLKMRRMRSSTSTLKQAKVLIPQPHAFYHA